ncbi:hypothetical protein B0A48_05362 [Cryoendolithus antarcticus]|uniref:alpha-amylase n=1 Tax=Cryoendolithus antarcticus TaxID=1507870 RepID=A0A1V8TI99_9PEZI|nr:hypothetical protein B0A48_05362 [Cryoendolithus antarcticus]
MRSFCAIGNIALFLIATALYFGTSHAADVDEWRTRSIYQVVTDRFAHASNSPLPDCHVTLGFYCGGTWRGIQDKLDYIQGMGFDAIWISPIVAQLPQQTGDGESYTAYWQQNLYQLNSDFGTENDLLELISDIHARGMLVMLDIVVNHMAYSGAPDTIDYSILQPFNDEKYYHSYCPVDDVTNSTNTEQCWLGSLTVPLADLRTEDEVVQEMFASWIKDTVQRFSIDGLRIDTAINVQPDFFPGFVDAAGVFATGEALNGDNSIACVWEEAIGSILNYPIYFPLIRAFTDPGGSINDLVETIESTKQNCHDATAMGSFSENHDVDRFASYTSSLALAANVITFNFLSDGIPITYQGQEQHMSGVTSPYTNRAPLWGTGFDTSATLYQHIATLNKFRQHVIRTSHNYTLYNNFAIYQDYHTLGMRKGYDGSQVLTILTNNGEDSKPYTLGLPNHGFPAGTKLTEILTCTDLEVNATGFINIPMSAGAPKILYPSTLLFDSKLCRFPNEAPASIAQPPQTTIVKTYATTISAIKENWAATTVSALPGMFTAQGESVSELTGGITGLPTGSIGAGVPDPMGTAEREGALSTPQSWKR